MSHGQANQEKRGGGYGWFALGAFVVAWDVLAPETLTNAFKRGAENPYVNMAEKLGAAAIVGHLFGLVPRELDVIYWPVDHWPLNQADIDKGATVFDQLPTLPEGEL